MPGEALTGSFERAPGENRSPRQRPPCECGAASCAQRLSLPLAILSQCLTASHDSNHDWSCTFTLWNGQGGPQTTAYRPPAPTGLL
jgi:hypothetical protein